MKTFVRKFFALGSDCALHLASDNESLADEAFAAAIQEIARIEARYSRYRPESLLSSINAVAHAGGHMTVDAETASLLDYACACFRLSGGLFDVTSGLLRRAWDFKSGRLPSRQAIDRLLPRIGLDKVTWQNPDLTFTRPGMEIDFGGIGKEYAVDRATEICQAIGIRSGLVDLGGDIRVIGPRHDGKAWSTGIRHPRNPESAIASVQLGAGALATSGDYERFMEVDGIRYCHLLDPHTGWPVHGLASVSVIADTCLAAGTLATIAMLKGDDGVPWLKSRGARYFCVDGAEAWAASETSDFRLSG